MKPPIITSSPLWTKARVLMLSSSEAGVGDSVGVGVGVAVGVALGFLAACIAAISPSDNAVVQIAACWMLPLAQVVGGLAGWRGCINDVRFGGNPPVSKVAVTELTTTPST